MRGEEARAIHRDRLIHGNSRFKHLRGAGILAGVPKRPVRAEDLAAAEAVIAKAAAGMGREMVPEVAPLLKRNLEHKRWDEVAARCLGYCFNCERIRT